MPSARASSSLKRRAERGLYAEVQKRKLSCGSWYETPYPCGWTGPKPERTRVVGAVSVLVESSLPLTCEEGIAPW